jgi:hypothetical protein
MNGRYPAPRPHLGVQGLLLQGDAPAQDSQPPPPHPGGCHCDYPQHTPPCWLPDSPTQVYIIIDPEQVSAPPADLPQCPSTCRAQMAQYQPALVAALYGADNPLLAPNSALP